MNLAQIIASLKAVVAADAAKSILPALATYFSSLAANPSALGLIAADAAFLGQLAQGGPAVEKDVLTTLAADLSAAATAASAAAGKS